MAVPGGVWAPSGMCGVGGIVVSIAAFQAVDPGSIPGQRKASTFLAQGGGGGPDKEAPDILNWMEKEEDEERW